MTIISARKALTAMFLAAGSVTWAAPASAQATRTWVSGVGDDLNPCSRTAPCKTFAGALTKTAAGGEINCLDPGGFGAVTITKSISIICDNTLGGALAGATSGVTINAAATDTIFLSGLDINGAGPILAITGSASSPPASFTSRTASSATSAPPTASASASRRAPPTLR